MRLSTYLTFNGQCKEAFTFYEKCLGGKIQMIMTNGDSPMADKTPADQRNRIMHAALKVGDHMLLGADAPPEYFTKPGGFCVMLDVNTPAEAEKAFSALAEGGKVNMPLQETFWAQRYGMLIDRYGQPWMVNCSKPM